MGQELEKLAQFVARTQWEDVPEPVQRHTKLVLLDTLGVILAGAERPEVRQLRERLAATAGRGATVPARLHLLHLPCRTMLNLTWSGYHGLSRGVLSMAADKGDEISIGVTAFKARCLALIHEVARGKTRRVLLTKRNRPIAAIVPVELESEELWGALRGTVKVTPGTDLTQGTGEIWEAET